MALLLAGYSSFAWVYYAPTYNGNDALGYTRGWHPTLSNVEWSSSDSFPLDYEIWRWGSPPFSNSSDGLGHGISWAVHPRFCDEIMPRFPERSVFGVKFVSCDDLRTTISRAFSTWAMNHVSISFNDVTDECHADLTSGRECASAELMIEPSDMIGSNLDRTLAAYVIPNVYTYDPEPYTTTGERLLRGYGMRHARMLISTETQWYLDATFCYQFNQLQSSDGGTDFVNIGRYFLIGTFALMFLVALYMIGRVVFAAAGVESCMATGDSRRRDVSTVGERTPLRVRVCLSIAAKISELPMGIVLMSTLFLTFGPTFYVVIFLPCWDGYDFEATLAHEIGHVLGFGHPDADTNRRLGLKPNRTMGTSTCLRPLDYVERFNTSTEVESHKTSPSLMFSFTLHRDSTCLLQDDLDGLNFLYPLCSPMDVRQTPLCVKQLRLLGYLRLALATSVPFATCAAIVMLAQQVSKMYHRRQVTALRNARRQSLQQIRSLEDTSHRQGMRNMWMRAALRSSLNARTGRANCGNDVKGGGHANGNGHAKGNGHANGNGHALHRGWSRRFPVHNGGGAVAQSSFVDMIHRIATGRVNRKKRAPGKSKERRNNAGTAGRGFNTTTTDEAAVFSEPDGMAQSVQPRPQRRGSCDSRASNRANAQSCVSPPDLSA